MDIRDLTTPCYIIKAEEYRENIRSFKAAFQNRWGNKVCFGYSIKTNNFPYMLKKAAEQGFFAEAVSPDEYEFAVRCGIAENRILYNGPQKRETVFSACENGAVVNLDNLEEVFSVCDRYENKNVRIRVGLRVNYDIERDCPGECTCEGIPGRFGISYENGDLKTAIDYMRKKGIKLSGLHLHQSSKTRSLRIYNSITGMAVRLGREFDLSEIDYIDIGGGYFGGKFFPGKPDVEQYAQTICENLKKFYDGQKTTLILEPGAAILATSMDYLTAVLNIRRIRDKRIVTVDGSVIHINPFMHPHETPFTMIDGGRETREEQIVGGSTCMELDRFYPRDLKNRLEKGSRLLFHCCGAYMSVHNSHFINSAPNIYLLENGEYTLLRQKSIDRMFL